jgi:hypothetical protein
MASIVAPRRQLAVLALFVQARSDRMPLPMQAVQILGAHVCPFPSQVHPSAGTSPPPWHAGQRSVRFMMAPMRVASHLVGFT